MKITCVVVGKIKEKYFTDAIKEYSKRIGRYCKLEIVELETGARTVLEEGVGPTQISIYPDGDTYKILAANHGAGEVTIYTLYKA